VPRNDANFGIGTLVAVHGYVQKPRRETSAREHLGTPTGCGESAGIIVGGAVWGAADGDLRCTRKRPGRRCRRPGLFAGRPASRSLLDRLV